MNELAGLQAFCARFLTAYLVEEYVDEVLPVMASLGPASTRTRTVRSRAAWREYEATEAGARHAECLARRDADPDAAITLDEARAIVRPLLAPERVAPLLSGRRIARFWATLPAMDPDKPNMLRYCVAAGARHPAFYEAVVRIASAQGERGEPFPEDLRSGIVGLLESKKPKGARGRPKNMERDLQICTALLVLQHLGLNPTAGDDKDREGSGCAIVADMLGRKYSAMASAYAKWRGELRAHGQLS